MSTRSWRGGCSCTPPVGVAPLDGPRRREHSQRHEIRAPLFNLAHQAGLAVIDRPLGFGDLTGSRTLATALAEERPVWEPGTRHGYHGQSLGW
ncbi:hypothetical protein ACFPZI_30770 [Streptomyces chlorus]|uniref:Uncharacterized protein n=1 Tax=Streptomyces chlorus TaxID=887452 RepID=A0ABW1E6N8_9ACTN